MNAASDGDEADRRVERLEQVPEVGGVGGDEGGRTGLRSCSGDERNGSVDDVRGAGTSTQHPGRARQRSFERDLVAMGQRSCEERLAAPIAPCLGDDASGHRHLRGVVSGVAEHRPDRAVIAI